MYKRVFLVVMDSVGCGTAPLSHLYGDEGANTIGHIAEATKGIYLPTLESLGYGNITPIFGVKPNPKPLAYYGRADELSTGKDTMTGHFEMVGIHTTQPFKTFTDTGFPKELIDQLEKETGHKVIGNVAASGTEILKELGEEHIKTGAMIVYTSADSVLQIACHETYFGLDELYRCCKIARELCMDEKYKVGRIIARPFLGEDKDTFKRTPNRHDYALSPAHETTLDALKKANYDVISIGKINDIFNTCGITEAHKTVSNHNGMEILNEVAQKDFTGLCFLNLVDFDALYGHRRDPKGYKECLEEFDRDLKNFLPLLQEDDLLMITADHGNDPTWSGTDHTREYVPILVYSPQIGFGNLGTRTTFADLGQTIADNFNVEKQGIGVSFFKGLKVMENFVYFTPTKIFFGKKEETKIGSILASYGGTKILLHYGKKSVVKSGLLARVKQSLDEHQISYLELAGVEPNPKITLVEKGVQMVKENGIDFILAIGGGSVIDSAKSIAVGACVEHSPWLFSTHEKTPEKAIPVGVILTLAASGSDMSDSCVITNDKTQEKRGFNSPLNRPKFAILNPELTYSVSPYQTACGIVDILMHTLERFISQTASVEPTDSIALALLKSVYQAGKIVMKNPNDYDARATLLWANSLSHNGLTSCGRSFIMSVHQLEHEVSGMFDSVAHGAGLAVLWPAWAMYAYPYAKERFKRLVYEVLEIPASDSLTNDIEKGIQKLKEYFQEIGMPTSLKELNISESDIKKLALNVTYNHTRTLKDVIEIDEEMALKILKLAL